MLGLSPHFENGHFYLPDPSVERVGWLDLFTEEYLSFPRGVHDDILDAVDCAVEAGRQAYKMAHVESKDVDVAEVHDCFTIAEIMAYENLGFCKPGEGGKLIEESQTYIGGEIPVNVDGGLLSKGHPIGATGGSQIRTIVLQLQGGAGKTQVDGAEIGLVHNIGGIGLYGNVTIFQR